MTKHLQELCGGKMFLFFVLGSSIEITDGQKTIFIWKMKLRSHFILMSPSITCFKFQPVILLNKGKAYKKSMKNNKNKPHTPIYTHKNGSFDIEMNTDDSSAFIIFAHKYCRDCFETFFPD